MIFRSRASWLEALCIVLVSAACGDEVVKLDESDVDALCFNADFAGEDSLVDFSFDFDGGGDDVRANEPVVISVFWSTENDTIDDITKSCSVERVGNELRISARARYTLVHANEGDHYAIQQAACVSDTLGAGRYVVTLGDRRVSLTVPSAGAKCMDFR